MLDAVMVETLGMAMHNAVSRQQGAGMISSAAVTAACARMLSMPFPMPPPPPPPPPPVVQPLPGPPPDAAPMAVVAAALAEGESAIETLKVQAGASSQAATVASQVAVAAQDLEQLERTRTVPPPAPPPPPPPGPPFPPIVLAAEPVAPLSTDAVVAAPSYARSYQHAPVTPGSGDAPIAHSYRHTVVAPSFSDATVALSAAAGPTADRAPSQPVGEEHTIVMAETTRVDTQAIGMAQPSAPTAKQIAEAFAQGEQVIAVLKEAQKSPAAAATARRYLGCLPRTRRRLRGLRARRAGDRRAQAGAEVAGSGRHGATLSGAACPGRGAGYEPFGNRYGRWSTRPQRSCNIRSLHGGPNHCQCPGH